MATLLREPVMPGIAKKPLPSGVSVVVNVPLASIPAAV